jgi:hypothetical protein
MLPDDAPNIASVRAGLTAEARRIRAQRNRQTAGVERFRPEQIRHRDLGGRSKPEIGVLNTEKIVGKFG